MNLYLVIILLLLIAVSAYMFYRTNKSERAIEQAFIEREGQIYIERMEQEKAEKQQLRA